MDMGLRSSAKKLSTHEPLTTLRQRALRSTSRKYSGHGCRFEEYCSRRATNYTTANLLRFKKFLHKLSPRWRHLKPVSILGELPTV